MELETPQQYLRNLALSNKIADPTNWIWRDQDRAMWKPAREELQDLRDRWYGNKSTSLLDPHSTFLAFDPLKSNTETNIVRRPYLAAFDTIWLNAMLRERIGKGVIVVDHPGVDMTPFGFYLLVRLLQMKQVVLFSPTGGHFHLFYHDGVYERAVSYEPGLPEPVSSSGVFIWSLFHMWQREEPASFMTTNYDSFPVQIAPPDSGYFRTWRKECFPLMTGLPVWTYEELAQALQYQRGYETLMSLLHKAFYRLSSGDKQWSDVLWSFNGARACLEDHILPENVQPTSPDDAMQYILDITIAYNGYNAHEVFHGVLGHETIRRHTNHPFLFSFSDLKSAALSLAGYQGVGVRHPQCEGILAMTPVTSTHGLTLAWTDTDWDIDFTSDWIARKAIQDMGVTDNHEIFRNVDSSPTMKRLAARFLEPLVHRCIAGTAPTRTSSWPLIQMICENDDDDAPCFHFPSPPLASGSVNLAKIEREVVNLSSIATLASCLKDNTYYIPKDPSFPLFDAFTVELDREHRSAVLWVFQVITSRVNVGSFMGYKKVRDIIAIVKDDLRAGESPQKKFKMSDHDIDNGIPSAEVEVRYVLAVPKRLWGFNDSYRLTEEGLKRLHGPYEADLPVDNFVLQFPHRWRHDRQQHDHCGNVYCLMVPLNV